MTWTNWGFDGTINEAQWSQMAGLLGNGYVAADASSCVTTAVPGARSVSVSAGTLYGDGIVSVNSAAKTVAMTTPVNGQWYVIALRRTWATNTVELVAVAGATTTTTTPTAPPSTLPTLNANPGVLADQPIAWAWCNSANTTVVVYDMRQFPVRRTPLTVANNVVRDGIFQTPTQGQQVWRNDLGAVETYYGLYNASTNPGGRDASGWYTDDRAGGLVPISPTTVTIASGSGSANSLGKVTFTGATSLSLDGVFSANFQNYKIVFKIAASTGSPLYLLSWRTGTPPADITTANYTYQNIYANNTTLTGSRTLNNSVAQVGVGSAGFSTDGELTIINPFAAGFTSTTTLQTNGVDLAVFGSTYLQGTSVTGFKIYPNAGNLSGNIQVFGYND